MEPGDRVRVEREAVEYEGIVLPSSDANRLVLKLDDGYNVGIDRDPATVEVLDAGARTFESTDAGGGAGASTITTDASLPTISLISTGGTIASTVDYRTGAVTAQFDAEDVLRAVPDLAGRANYRGRVVTNILSENMRPDVWQELAQAVHEEIEAGADGVVVMHGTDTMQYSAAALSFMLETPVPIVFTGSQRSADRPSSDNVMNAVCAVEAAKSDCAEVLICMHDSSSDDRCALHRGVRTRKNHTSRRDAFETVGRDPLGIVDYDVVHDQAGSDVGSNTGVTFRRAYHERGRADLTIAVDIEPNVELVKFTPGMDPAHFDAVSDAEGLIVEGTGLGHVSTDLVPTLASFVEDGMTVAMTSQCLDGRVCDRVYDTGRDLLEAGVIEAEDTLPETALVKLMWVLEHREDPAAAMRESLAGECTTRSVPWM